MRREFTGVCLVTKDVIKLRQFYQDVLLAETEGDEIHSLVHLDAFSFAIYNPAIHENSTIPVHDSGGGSVVLQFQVDDVDVEHERLKELDVEIIAPPTTHPWGRRAMQFRDPDGNVITFYVVVS
jgi:uncharacterized glyoxalase superfamily protein PhnB